MDQNIAMHCLKLLVLILNSTKTQNLASHLNQEFISLLFSWKNDSEIDNKTKGIVDHVLIKVEKIKPEYFAD